MAIWDGLHPYGSHIPMLSGMEYYRKNAKLGHVGTQPTSRDLLLNFGTASISFEWLKLETSNLVPRLTGWSTIEKMQN